MFVDEYQEIHDAILAGDYDAALAILDEMDEMSRSDKVSKIKSHMRVLLIHLIKRAADEGRSTRSWDNSIENSVEEIRDTNKRDRSGGWYLEDVEISELLGKVWSRAVRDAALEVHRGEHTTGELATMVDRETILAEAMRLLETAKEG